MCQCLNKQKTAFNNFIRIKIKITTLFITQFAEMKNSKGTRKQKICKKKFKIYLKVIIMRKISKMKRLKIKRSMQNKRDRKKSKRKFSLNPDISTNQPVLI